MPPMSTPPGPLRLALCQMNATVGDIAGNERKISDGIAAARGQQAELVLFPELALTGYPPEDLLLKEHFLQDTRRALDRLAAETHGIVALVGFPERDDDVYNALAVLADGAVQGIYRKNYLPNYGVFDEQRYFATGDGGALIEVGEVKIGLTICEDIWEPGAPASDEAYAGASVIVNLSASPYHAGKAVERERMLIQRARDSMCVVAFCGLVGGQDELVFDGHSLVVDHRGEVIARAGQFTEELLVATVDPLAPRTYRLRDARHRAAGRDARPVPTIARLELPETPADDEHPLTRGPIAPLLEPTAEVYTALVCGLRDYVRKNGFDRVVLGLSGGVDSALVACVAVDALGPDGVAVAVMPSPYSSQETQADARQLADNLGVERYEFNIQPAMRAYASTLADTFAGRKPDLTEENLQARIRGNLLMALSNKFGWLVLATGNKSEMSVGYSTLYGDLAGGFAVIKDCPKLRVYELTRYRDALARETTGRELVPAMIIDRPRAPSCGPTRRTRTRCPPTPSSTRSSTATSSRTSAATS